MTVTNINVRVEVESHFAAIALGKRLLRAAADAGFDGATAVAKTEEHDIPIAEGLATVQYTQTVPALDLEEG